MFKQSRRCYCVFIVNFEHIPQNLKHAFHVYVDKTMFQIVKIVATMEYFLVHYNPVLSYRVKFHSFLCTEL